MNPKPRAVFSSWRLRIISVLLLFCTAALVSLGQNATAQNASLELVVAVSDRRPTDGAGGTGVLVFDNALLDRVFGHDRAPSAADAARPNDTVSLLPPIDPRQIPPPLLYPDQPFTAKLGAGVAGPRAIALRFAEHGRVYLQTGDLNKALDLFEKALGIGADPFSPYFYFYLAQTHFHLAHYQISHGFLTAAESWLAEYPEWVVPLNNLRQDNKSALACNGCRR
jgi:tetratricopeptide (TPR) repeat protein